MRWTYRTPVAFDLLERKPDSFIKEDGEIVITESRKYDDSEIGGRVRN